jgi:hypothetical protein
MTYSDNNLLIEALHRKEISALSVVYDRYAGAFYGEIKRTLHKQAESEQALLDSFHAIWKAIPQLDPSKEQLFTWCLKRVRKEISKRKVNMMLHEVFACQDVFF